MMWHCWLWRWNKGPQAKECSSRNWKRQEKGFSPRASRGSAAWRTPWFWPSELILDSDLSATKFVITCYSSHRKLIHQKLRLFLSIWIKSLGGLVRMCNHCHFSRCFHYQFSRSKLSGIGRVHESEEESNTGPKDMLPKLCGRLGPSWYSTLEQKSVSLK